jgi:two-component system, response regulator, stage 0 sporulation protein F
MTTTDRAQPSSSPTRILLAEDDGDFRMLVSLKLRDAGFDVTEASDGQDLLERLIDGYSPDGAYDPFDMVLSDINMPHFDALDVMVGARSCLATTAVVLMTSFGDAHTHARALSLGATAVLDKPLRLDDLSARLIQILNQSGRAPVRPH